MTPMTTFALDFSALPSDLYPTDVVVDEMVRADTGEDVTPGDLAFAAEGGGVWRYTWEPGESGESGLTYAYAGTATIQGQAVEFEGEVPPADDGGIPGTAPADSTAVGSGVTRDLAGNILPNTPVTVQLITPSRITDTWSNTSIVITSNSNGEYNVVLGKGNQYIARVKAGYWQDFVVPDTDTFDMPVLYG